MTLLNKLRFFFSLKEAFVMAKVLVAMGSKSDLDAVKPAVSILKRFGVDVTV